MNMKNKLELQWINKNKALYYDIFSGKYEWVDKKILEFQTTHPNRKNFMEIKIQKIFL